MSEKTTRRQPRQFVEQFRIWLRAGGTDRIYAAATQEARRRVLRAEHDVLVARTGGVHQHCHCHQPDTEPPVAASHRSATTVPPRRVARSRPRFVRGSTAAVPVLAAATAADRLRRRQRSVRPAPRRRRLGGVVALVLSARHLRRGRPAGSPAPALAPRHRGLHRLQLGAGLVAVADRAGCRPSRRRGGDRERAAFRGDRRAAAGQLLVQPAAADGASAVAARLPDAAAGCPVRAAATGRRSRRVVPVRTARAGASRRDGACAPALIGVGFSCGECSRVVKPSQPTPSPPTRQDCGPDFNGVDSLYIGFVGPRSCGSAVPRFRVLSPPVWTDGIVAAGTALTSFGRALPLPRCSSVANEV